MNALKLIVGFFLAACSTAVSAQSDYPTRLIRIVVPFPPGGPTDLVARPLAQKLSANLGQPVIIDNHGGAGSTIGGNFVAKSPPDGYTLLMGTVGTQAIDINLYQKLVYDPAKDLAPVSNSPRNTLQLYVSRSSIRNRFCLLAAASDIFVFTVASR